MGNQQTAESKTVVILGAGYLGYTIAQLLNKEPQFRITLVDKKNFFEDNLAAVRYLVNPDFFASQSKKYDSLTKISNVKFIHAQVEKLNEKQVIAKSMTSTGETITLNYDYLVITTGSSYSLFKSGLATQEERRKEIEEVSKSIEKAKSILVVGGRSVGIEVIGEIVDRYPSKKITLVHSKERLMDEQAPRAHQMTMNFMNKHNVQVILSDKVLSSTSSGDKIYKTENGKTIEADYIIWATGYKVNTGFIRGSFLEAELTEQGFINTSSTLQIKGFDNIFAAGDILAYPNVAKLAYNGHVQAELVAHNLVHLVNAAHIENYDPEKAAKFGLVHSMGNTYGLFTPNESIVMSGRWVAYVKNYIFNKVMKEL
jgi:NADH dehydrogenase FAD-containing subunit